MNGNPYETRKLVSEYLFFHYADDVSGGLPVPSEALGFPARLVRELLDPDRSAARALDLGCAVGRSTFELSRTIPSVCGIDFSAAFIAAAQDMKAGRPIECALALEGERTFSYIPKLPGGVAPSRVSFETGDAMELRPDLGAFDVVLAANLLCRLPEPRRFLARLPALVSPGGQLLLATPFSWLPEFTPRAHWIGGIDEPSWDVLRRELEPDFDLQFETNLPFLIREHSRKFQYGISLGTRWIRRS
jgi:putative 4-mercaptohistidine N1-methyltranferase